MSLREFSRISRAYYKRLEVQYRERWQHTAMQCSYIANMVGGAVAGKKWKQVQPQDLVKRWLDGATDIEDRRARLKRARERHKARLMREKTRKAL